MALGTLRGWRGSYRSPDGVRFDAVVLRPERPDEYPPADAGERLACVGWQAVVVHGGVVFAASSGTPQVTRTPETPVEMERTAVPGSAGAAGELLSHSPALTPKTVEADAVGCER